MIDEEMAEEYCNNEVPFDTTESGEKLYTKNDLKYAYLAGLKAGRPKWHKVADGDLPPEYTEFLNDDGVKVIRVNGHWRYVYGGEWEDDACVDYWCEIPKYTEE